MTIVLVHGVPETAAVWDPLLGVLGRSDVETVRLPGFGSAPPSGFGATKEEYVVWLIGELERIGTSGPVDLVGHDWGGGFVVRVVSTRPELVRSWVTDAGAIGDPAFEWHDFAKIWQTPGEGEEFFAQQLATPVEDSATVFEAYGVPLERARALAGWADEQMARCILALYRSAVDVGREWGPDFHDIAKPGLILLPSDDPFLSADGARSSVKRTGAALSELPGVGHWWMLQDPARAAAVLTDFWASVL
ncbi:MAG TPA: alpha/beta hydrolase [Acidimicrobiales bacterium]|nr:alpha/beta hydrolase [Acidimicrobiales bacterium]